jgi:hypothetical protein
MFRKDGQLEKGPDNVIAHPLVRICLTEQWQVIFQWENEQLQQALQSKLSIADLSRFKDGLTVALKQSLDKRLPTVINIS